MALVTRAALTTIVVAAGVSAILVAVLDRSTVGRTTLAARDLSPASLRPGALPVAGERDLSWLAGAWRGQDGTHVIVTAKGEVWSDAGSLQGWMEPPREGANVVFGDGRFFCAYQVTMSGDTVAAWRLVDRSAQAPCPSGRFAKPWSL